jgi:alpha-glucosidase/alpha-D-xyloside xylohydrolase
MDFSNVTRYAVSSISTASEVSHTHTTLSLSLLSGGATESFFPTPIAASQGLAEVEPFTDLQVDVFECDGHARIRINSASGVRWEPDGIIDEGYRCESGSAASAVQVEVEVTEDPFAVTVFRVNPPAGVAGVSCTPTDVGAEFPGINNDWCTDNCFDGAGVLSAACDPAQGVQLCVCAGGSPTRTAIFDSTGHPLFFSDRYIEWGSASAASSSQYGLGERNSPLVLEKAEEGKAYTLFATENQFVPDWPLYSAHPFMLSSEGDASPDFNGLFALTSNAADIVLYPESYQLRLTGGMVDLFVFAGPGPEQVVQQFHTVVGAPFFPPLWSLGFHQCRYGFEDVGEVNFVLDQFESEAIPVDVIWVDIDYMNGFRDFTFDESTFSQTEMLQLSERVRAAEQRLVYILDPIIKIDEDYDTYTSGVEDNVFIRDYTGEDLQRVKSWPIVSVLPDFTHPNSTAWWTREVQKFFDMSPFDGLWLDMNEVTSFCDGRCVLDIDVENALYEQGTLYECTCSEFLYESSLRDDPPYQPAKGQRQCRASNDREDVAGLDCGTISMESRYYGQNGYGEEDLEYNMHNLYGMQQTAATVEAVRQVISPEDHLRPFVLTRAAFPGSGRLAAKWLGDNKSEWQDLRESVQGVLGFNMYGMPHVGADVCGFGGDSTPELCVRWTQFAAVAYPFFRNHNGLGYASQEPYVWGEPFTSHLREAIQLRYWLMPYLYGLFYRVHTEGGAIVKPLFFAAPNDPYALSTEEQVLLGDALLVTPVLYKDAETVRGYFPNVADWYNLADGSLQLSKSASRTTGDERFVNLNAPLDVIPIHVRSGKVVPLYLANDAVKTTEDLQAFGEYELVVALDSSVPTDAVMAAGDLYADDGVTELEFSEGGALTSFSVVKNTSAGDFTLSSTTVSVGGHASASLDKSNSITSIRIMGACSPSGVAVNDVSIPSSQISVNSETGQVTVEVSVVSTSAFVLKYACQ